MENECAVLTIEIHLLLEHLLGRDVMLSAIIVLLSSGIDNKFALAAIEIHLLFDFCRGYLLEKCHALSCRCAKVIAHRVIFVTVRH
jgi:hypothetical protein